jgi:hypothetical protein
VSKIVSWAGREGKGRGAQRFGYKRPVTGVISDRGSRGEVNGKLRERGEKSWGLQDRRGETVNKINLWSRMNGAVLLGNQRDAIAERAKGSGNNGGYGSTSLWVAGKRGILGRRVLNHHDPKTALESWISGSSTGR